MIDQPKFNLNLDEARMIRNRLIELNTSTPAIIIKDLANDESKQAELLFLLWFDIANYYITFDTNKQLTMNTLIWINKHE